jgi:N-acetylmuramoyl-L-alanine amidase
MSRTVSKIIVHCSASRAPLGVEGIRKLHKSRGWKDVGYHYVISPNGDIEFGRPEEQIGAHAEGHNHDSIGVCLDGLDDFGETQIVALIRCVRSLMKKHNLKVQAVFCHYEVDSKGKTCPNIPSDVLRMLVKGESEWKTK